MPPPPQNSQQDLLEFDASVWALLRLSFYTSSHPFPYLTCSDPPRLHPVPIHGTSQVPFLSTNPHIPASTPGQSSSWSDSVLLHAQQKSLGLTESEVASGLLADIVISLVVCISSSFLFHSSSLFLSLGCKRSNTT